MNNPTEKGLYHVRANDIVSQFVLFLTWDGEKWLDSNGAECPVIIEAWSKDVSDVMN